VAQTTAGQISWGGRRTPRADRDIQFTANACTTRFPPTKKNRPLSLCIDKTSVFLRKVFSALGDSMVVAPSHGAFYRTFSRAAVSRVCIRGGPRAALSANRASRSPLLHDPPAFKPTASCNTYSELFGVHSGQRLRQDPKRLAVRRVNLPMAQQLHTRVGVIDFHGGHARIFPRPRLHFSSGITLHRHPNNGKQQLGSTRNGNLGRFPPQFLTVLV